MKRVWEIAEPIVAHCGMEIVDIEFRPEGRGAVLRFFLDREGGVTLDDLAPFNRRIGDVLEVHDVVPGKFTLEVSSPGINRRLRTPEHFRRFVGKRIRVKTCVPRDGRRLFTGVLHDVEDDGVRIQIGDELCAIGFSEIAQANYEHDFGSGPGMKTTANVAQRGKRWDRN